jgi:hypothetical protein
MTFDDILAQVITLLKRQERVSYRALKRRFAIDDDYIEDLKAELLYVHPVLETRAKDSCGRATLQGHKTPSLNLLSRANRLFSSRISLLKLNHHQRQQFPESDQPQ